jgi:hypothetical protein
LKSKDSQDDSEYFNGLLGMVRRVAASLLKQDTGRGSIKAKRFGAALDEQYLERVLQGFTVN